MLNLFVMIKLFCFFLPSAVCLIALPSIALKLRKQPNDGWLLAVCGLLFLYFITDLFPEHQYLFWCTKLLGLLLIPCIYIWICKLLDDCGFHSSSLFIQIRKHYKNQDWSAMDKYLMRIDISILVAILIEIIDRILMYFYPNDTILAILAVFQAIAVYFFFSSSIYIGIINNPALNRDTLRAVQQARQSKLRDDFEALMTEQKPYLKQGITIEDIALMLATNRTYVSRMLHDDYSCTFPEYMLEKRLEYSKTFMLEHPHDVQEEVAFQCGFASASAFNKRFREQYGITPREWQLQNRK